VPATPPAAQEEQDAASPYDAVSWGRTLAEGSHGGAGASRESEPQSDSFEAMARFEQSAASAPAGEPAPHHATFDQAGVSGSGGIPTWGVEERQHDQPSGEFPAPVWGAETDAAASVDVNPFKPVSNPLQPDFSSLYEQDSAPAFNPLSGTDSTPSTATGQFSAVRRPDLPEVGGAKHFKWLHLAVIGALMFVLGVVIYNAAFAQ